MPRCLQHPPSLLPTRVSDSLLIHASINNSQSQCHCHCRKATGRTHEVSGWISPSRFLASPNPLCDNLACPCRTIVQCCRDAHGCDTRNVTGNPGAQGRGTGESTAGAEDKSAVALCIGVCGKEASSKPAYATDGGGESNMKASCVQAIGRVGQS